MVAPTYTSSSSPNPMPRRFSHPSAGACAAGRLLAPVGEKGAQQQAQVQQQVAAQYEVENGVELVVGVKPPERMLGH